MDDRLENVSAERPIAIADPPRREIDHLRFKSTGARAAAPQRRSLALDLRRAIENNELTLHYQPQFEIERGRACGVEALARWFRRDGSIVEPNVFIPLAEQTHLIGLLGSWVLREACTTVSRWKWQCPALATLCVNVSAHQINGTFAAIVSHIVERAGLPARHLELEITESALLENSAAVIECFRELKQLGVRIAIDDFGVGYSNLSHLSRLPVDRLKLDRSLIHNFTCQWKDAAILRSVIALGKDLGITVIAEGVETEQQFQLLKQLGCPQVQGYWLGRPAPEREAQRMLARRWGTRVAPPSLAVHAAPENCHAP